MAAKGLSYFFRRLKRASFSYVVTYADPEVDLMMATASGGSLFYVCSCTRELISALAFL